MAAFLRGAGIVPRVFDPLENNLDVLTEQQAAAVGHGEGPALVLAGPGSGKTRVITQRLARLVQLGIPPYQLLALTFTNKAASEMRERVLRLLPHDSAQRGVVVATFHSFCARQLRVHAKSAGIETGFSIYDTSDQKSAMKDALKRADIDTSTFTPSQVLAAVSQAKNKLQTAAMFAEDASDFFTRSIARAYTAYENLLRHNNAVDFDDLLLLMARILTDDKAVRTDLQDRFQYVLIDEYQDTNHAQFVIADAIAHRHGNLFVVGDPDQSIYGWRGADIRNILEFESEYPGAAVLPLGENFRSTGHIVGASAALIAHNRHRKQTNLFTELDDGELVSVMECRDEKHEAECVVKRVQEAAKDDVAYRSMAVLYRINALSRVLEDAFRRAGIPYVIARGTAFYQRREIKDALAYLRALANSADEVALGRIVNVPTRGIGARTVGRLERFAMHNSIPLLSAFARANEVDGLAARAVKAVSFFSTMLARWRSTLADAHAGQLAGFVAQVITESGLEAMHTGAALGSQENEEGEERVANLNELVNAAAEFQLADDILETTDAPDGDGALGTPTLSEALSGFLEAVSLVSDADSVDDSRGAVTLMTLHAAKGLEFDLVAMVGLEENILPHSRSMDGERSIEEERRLCYVGMTRAKRHLQMTSARTRSVRGQFLRSIPSCFLSELPKEHLNKESLDEGFDGFTIEYDGVDEDPDASFGLAARFPAGTVVRHKEFGIGTVRSVAARGTASAARVAFHTVGVKTLILEYAKLERLHD